MIINDGMANYYDALGHVSVRMGSSLEDISAFVYGEDEVVEHDDDEPLEAADLDWPADEDIEEDEE